ncbi:MAG: hydroxymethylglutaryl-CoA reductase, degradative [Nitrososphaeraceae archaeon]|jgi:hydroxymethylglutaryl-CoA reductase|nr:hydroxymethylglutaryl-CoA reductase, degradative [Nitrososphaeraceae archaeon]MDW0138036.1 hydroxymethylglutaryl-CoA reductase, degradative [Nitrososphaeraceae archaeon]MDW0138426.1 hydroxymethylglutaryl-CoA reductase, degradative [Nitrososphaeraceae archaeon]MDW0144366.1 hydroxymethylglutaryl-CoA reductase, degradative [Nitrososphaeraceae archaeon]MDW0145279.1 hydroxymethylglutaryl-CoA reductase, degradative [Nitrososphaeraceae archaeon]
MNTEKKFYEMSLDERLSLIASKSNLTKNEISTVVNQPLPFDKIDRMIENAVGSFSLPLGIATNFVINGKEYLVPMAIEEPSVIAAASHAAKLAKSSGGFKASAESSIMRGQIQVTNLLDIKKAIQVISKNKESLLRTVNSISNNVKALDLKTRIVENEIDGTKMLAAELYVDCKDSMGANTINSMCELLGPEIEQKTSGKVILKILSNYATERIATSKATFKKEELGGTDIVDRILSAFAFAFSDTYRAVTHNKGIMNGIDAVSIATGQDFRAIEAAAHAYASRDGKYRSLTTFSKSSNGDLVGRIEIPLSVGIVGGISIVHPVARMGLKILGVKSASELACVIASAGLAQNLAAIRALSTEGIQKGHMKLHAKNIAVAAGATGKLVDIVSETMYKQSKISLDSARRILQDLRHSMDSPS